MKVDKHFGLLVVCRPTIERVSRIYKMRSSGGEMQRQVPLFGCQRLVETVMSPTVRPPHPDP
jgi:hypothetical protein